MMMDDNNLVWLDLEMTGLDPDKDHILEIATVITNSNLEILATGPVFAIYQPDERLTDMDEWNTEHHTNSGLIERVKKSNITTANAEEATLAFIKQYVPSRRSPMCGNSICQDRRFLYRHMTKLERYFHYRNLDVSTLKILAQHWAPHIATKLSKASHHIALEDIRDSIAELKFYRKHLMQY